MLRIKGSQRRTKKAISHQHPLKNNPINNPVNNAKKNNSKVCNRCYFIQQRRKRPPRTYEKK